MYFTLSQDTEVQQYLETIRRIHTVMDQNDMLKISKKNLQTLILFVIICTRDKKVLLNEKMFSGPVADYIRLIPQSVQWTP